MTLFVVKCFLLIIEHVFVKDRLDLNGFHILLDQIKHAIFLEYVIVRSRRNFTIQLTEWWTESKREMRISVAFQTTFIDRSIIEMEATHL